MRASLHRFLRSPDIVTSGVISTRAIMSCFHCASASRALSSTATHQGRPVFSEGSDETGLTKKLSVLLDGSPEGGRWSLMENGKGLERTFRFKTFKKTWEFMNVVAAQCGKEKHHPEWSNVYNTTFIRWTTHSPPGLSGKDITMAAFCDEQASAHGVLEDTPEAEKVASGKSLADRVATEGGDCCVPKSQKKEKDGKTWNESDWGVDG